MFDKQESDAFRLPAELAGLEQQLAGLTAMPPRLDRDRLMFEAGRAAATRNEGRGARSELMLRSRFWPATTAAMTAATVVLATMLMWPELWRGAGAKPQADRIASATDQRDGGAKAADAVTDNEYRIARYPAAWMGADGTSAGYLGIRYVALTRGVDALERESSGEISDLTAPASPVNARQLLKELLPKAKEKDKSI